MPFTVLREIRQKKQESDGQRLKPFLTVVLGLTKMIGITAEWVEGGFLFKNESKEWGDRTNEGSQESKEPEKIYSQSH